MKKSMDKDDYTLELHLDKGEKELLDQLSSECRIDSADFVKALLFSTGILRETRPVEPANAQCA